MENQVQEQTSQATESQTQQTSDFTVPEAYREKGWAKDIKSSDDLWKLTDNAQSLIGKRPAGIPQEGASSEEWDKFYTAMGRPESAEKYQFSDIEGLPEGTDLSPFKQKAGSIFLKAGLNQRQADAVWKEFIAAEMGAATENSKAYHEKQAALDKEFDEITKKVFGDNYDNAAKAAQDLINKFVPEEMAGAYEGLADNPKAMAAVIKALEGAQGEIARLHKEYGAEGSLTSGQQAGSMSMEDTVRELSKLRTSNEARDFLHPDHKRTMEKIKELSSSVQRAYNK